MVAYAKAATIRERQLEEKEREWQNFKVQEKKKDKIIEALKKVNDKSAFIIKSLQEKITYNKK